jgi:hypothetical protein
MPLTRWGGIHTVVHEGETVFVKPNFVTIPWAQYNKCFHAGECTKPEIIIAVIALLGSSHKSVEVKTRLSLTAPPAGSKRAGAQPSPSCRSAAGLDARVARPRHPPTFVGQALSFDPARRCYDACMRDSKPAENP